MAFYFNPSRFTYNYMIFTRIILKRAVCTIIVPFGIISVAQCLSGRLRENNLGFGF